LALDERILIEQLKNGEESAFRTIVEKWQDMVYNTALGIVQNAEDAEDIAQEAFVQVYQSIHTFKGESKFSTWLYRITIAKALDHERRKKRKKRFGIVKKIFGKMRLFYRIFSIRVSRSTKRRTRLSYSKQFVNYLKTRELLLHYIK